jgi:hypothetical protein
MFNWKGFENREFCVVFKNRADEMDFLKKCENRGYKWGNGEKATNKTGYRDISCLNKELLMTNSLLNELIYNPHPIDCSIAENYIMERNRIRNENCGISNEIYAAELDGNPEKAIEIVQKWSDEHPVVTYLDKLLEAFPNAKIGEGNVPLICPNKLGLNDLSCDKKCVECWSQPYKENNNE